MGNLRDEAVNLSKILMGTCGSDYCDSCAVSIDLAVGELYRIRAEARTEALKEAADRAIDWYIRTWKVSPVGPCADELRAAIFADQAPEAGKVEGPRENRVGIYAEIEAERIRQDEKWGEQNHPIREEHKRAIEYYKEEAEAFRKICDLKARENRITWYDIIIEEFFEAFAEDTPEGQRAELVQMIAVGVAMIECIDRRARAAIEEEE